MDVDSGSTSRAAAPGRTFRLAYRSPLPLADLVDFLGVRAVPGVEHVVDGTYHRVLRLPGGRGRVALSPGTGPWVDAHLRVGDARDTAYALAACRRLLDLDADPATVDGVLGADPVLAPLVAATPGRRAPGHVDPAELAVRAVLGQQVSLGAARRLAGRLAALCGDPLDDAEPSDGGESLGDSLKTPGPGLRVAFPSPAAIAEADLDRLGMPGTRRATVRALATVLADGDVRLEPGADPDEAERRLLEIKGIGPWTAGYIRMRGLGDPDVLLTTDLGVRHALKRLGLADAPDLAARWSPWGSYAVHHLWASLADG